MGGLKETGSKTKHCFFSTKACKPVLAVTQNGIRNLKMMCDM